jgi:hypothetical protein
MMNSACQPLSAVVVDVNTSDNRCFVDAGVRELKPRVGWAFATGVAHGRLEFKETGAPLPLELLCHQSPSVLLHNDVPVLTRGLGRLYLAVAVQVHIWCFGLRGLGFGHRWAGGGAGS